MHYQETHDSPYMLPSVSARFTKMDTDRTGVLEDARSCAAITIPRLLPPIGHSECETLPQPYITDGTLGCNALASNLLLSLLPPHSSFFNGEADPTLIADLQAQIEQATPHGQEAPSVETQFENLMIQVEKFVQSEVEVMALRPKAYEHILQSIVVGYSLMFVPDEGPAKVFRADRFVVDLDGSGQLLELITKEIYHKDTLPDDLKKIAESQEGQAGLDTKDINSSEVNNTKGQVAVFHRMIRTDEDTFQVTRYVGDAKVEGSEREFPASEPPFIYTPWSLVDGENYGKGHVHANFGDLQCLETLWKSLTEAAEIASLCIPMVRPSSMTNITDLARGQNGKPITGNHEDVGFFRVDKHHDMTFAYQMAQALQGRLAQSFLRTSSVERHAERVTAEEIRAKIQELETALGGVYSRYSDTFQRPLLNRLIRRLIRQDKIDESLLDGASVRFKITAGIDAVGRGHEANKYLNFMQIISQIPNGQQFMKVGPLIRILGQAIGVDITQVVKTPAEIQAELQAAQQAQMMQQVAPGVAQEAVKGEYQMAQQNTENQ